MRFVVDEVDEVDEVDKNGRRWSATALNEESGIRPGDLGELWFWNKNTIKIKNFRTIRQVMAC